MRIVPPSAGLAEAPNGWAPYDCAGYRPAAGGPEGPPSAMAASAAASTSGSTSGSDSDSAASTSGSVISADSTSGSVISADSTSGSVISAMAASAPASSGGGSGGRWTVKVVPEPILPWADTVPPWLATMELTIER